MSPADAIRRAVDVLAAVAGLIVLWPVLLAAAVAVRVSMGPGVICARSIQRRMGTDAINTRPRIVWMICERHVDHRIRMPLIRTGNCIVLSDLKLK